MRPWEKYFRKVEPYVPGEQPKFEKMIKLNTNENPYPPSPEVEKVLREVNCDKLKMYPDPTSEVLVRALAERYQVKEDQVFVGVGSDDVLGMAFLTFFGSDKPILFPDITYSFYDVWAELFQIPYERPALDADFRIKKEDYYKENGGVIITNPNAPTSICENLDFLRDILEHNQDVVVIVDEAYIDFGGESALPLLKEYENLLVVQTFSKSRSMAGMRIGYAFGHPALIQAMNDVKYSYNSYTMDYLTLVTGVAALEDEAYFKKNCDKIIVTRQRTMERLRQLGFAFPNSKTNFLFATHKTVPAKELFEALRKEKIFVRYFDKPRIDNYLRITIGTDEEMDALIHFLENYLNGNTF
jgi:histidinol-phosphate aminotransferase